jgi:RNA polymerase sigma factor (sigma-70 family)
MTRVEIKKLTDKELILLFQTGCNYAFDCLYERHYQAVYRYLRNLTLNREAAQDLAQDLFLKVLVCFKENKFIGTDFFSQYLRRSCYYTFIDNKRKFKDNVSESDFSFDNLESDAKDMHQILIKEETNIHIKSLFDTLPEQNRKIINMYLQDGMKFIAIANELKTPQSTVVRRYTTSIETLKIAVQRSNMKFAI